MVNQFLLYKILLISTFAISPVVFIYLTFFPADYGRYADVKQYCIPNRWGWILMELPMVIVFLFYLPAMREGAYALFALWELHYGLRTFIYPLRLKNPDKPMPLVTPLSGIVTNILIAYINSFSIARIHFYPIAWFYSPQFIIGLLLFFTGFAINQYSDMILFNLREKKTNEYKIPYGGLYRWITCPNYLGEIIQWFGWAIATWSLAGLAFAIYTMANLVPRALTHHKWYHTHFPDYPKERRALIFWLL